MDLNQLLVLMVEKKGEMLHIVAGSPPMTKPQSGSLFPLTSEVLSSAEVKAILENALTAEQKKALSEEKELNTAYSVEGLGRFRTTIFFQRGTLAAVFRLMPQNPPDLDELGLPPILKEIAAKPQGLILIIGPKGSGKSQTLAALLDHLLSSRGIEVFSIENPIEFLLKNQKGVIYQRELGTDALSFKQALRTALRQSPDVLVLSELPDLETVHGVLGAASSGQLVVATITANGVLMAIEQMVDLAPPHAQVHLRSQLAAGLELALSQLLVTMQDGSMAMALEVLVGTLQAKNTIREGRIQQLVSVMNNGREHGMISQELALKNLIRKNLITSEEAMSKAARPEELKRLLAFQI